MVDSTHIKVYCVHMRNRVDNKLIFTVEFGQGVKITYSVFPEHQIIFENTSYNDY
jgi:hypothetical protein